MSDQAKVQTHNSTPTTYSIRMAVKTPSRVMQYRMLEADVTVTGEDIESLRSKAIVGLATSLSDVCLLMGETPPEELRPILTEALGSDAVNSIYADE